MSKLKLSVTDNAGHMLYDEWVDAAGLMEACRKAVIHAWTADVAKTEEQLAPMQLATGNDEFSIGASVWPDRSPPRTTVIGSGCPRRVGKRERLLLRKS